jgi:hypothetical protein
MQLPEFPAGQIVGRLARLLLVDILPHGDQTYE